MLKERTGTVADLTRMWDIRTAAIRLSFASHYEARVMEVMCDTPPPPSMHLLISLGGARVIEEDQHMVGYAILDIHTGEVDAVFVEPEHQGRGIALRLLHSLEAIALEHQRNRLFLSSSLNAVRFYKRAGFAAIREEIYPHRSGLGIASVYMEKHLSAAAIETRRELAGI